MKNLTNKQHGLLCEALRRWTRFHSEHRHETLTTAWTGLGCLTEYKPAFESGFMVPAYNIQPRTMGWWVLTDKGAAIVQKWLDTGYTYQDIEGDGKLGLPPYDI